MLAQQAQLISKTPVTSFMLSLWQLHLPHNNYHGILHEQAEQAFQYLARPS